LLRTGFRQGFLCNATNPKILVFYLSLLPQFVSQDADWWVWLLHAWTLPVIGTAWCLLVVALVDAARQQLARRRFRQAIDTIAGVVMLGFCARLTQEA
jgi:threonine/homoserine/homoserine lactone efflux protein